MMAIREERMMMRNAIDNIDEEREERREYERQNWDLHKNENPYHNFTDEEIAYLFGENE